MPIEITDRQLELIGARLDGAASDEEIVELEREFDGAPELRARFETLAGIEGGLREAFRDCPPVSAPRVGAFRRYAAAAALVLAVCGAWWFGLGPSNPVNPLSGSRVHARFVADPEPDVVCDTPEKFLAYTREKLGVGIGADFSGGVTFVGWRGMNGSYAPKPGDTTEPRVLTLYTASGEPVVVVFQPAGDPRPSLEASVDLNRFKKRFGSITAWEVSRLDRPVALPRLVRE